MPEGIRDTSAQDVRIEQSHHRWRWLRWAVPLAALTAALILLVSALAHVAVVLPLSAVWLDAGYPPERAQVRLVTLSAADWAQNGALRPPAPMNEQPPPPPKEEAERAEDTRQDLAVRLLWLGTLTQLLLFDLFHRTVRVNMGRVPSLETYWLDIGAFGLAVAFWLTVLVWHYRRAPAAVRSSRRRRPSPARPAGRSDHRGSRSRAPWLTAAGRRGGS